MQNSYEKMVKLKDIHNIATTDAATHTNTFEDLITEMKKLPGKGCDEDFILSGKITLPEQYWNNLISPLWQLHFFN